MGMSLKQRRLANLILGFPSSSFSPPSSGKRVGGELDLASVEFQWDKEGSRM